MNFEIALSKDGFFDAIPGFEVIELTQPHVMSFLELKSVISKRGFAKIIDSITDKAVLEKFYCKFLRPLPARNFQLTSLETLPSPQKSPNKASKRVSDNLDDIVITFDPNRSTSGVKNQNADRPKTVQCEPVEIATKIRKLNRRTIAKI
ncbi:hypothetical protein Ciccas_005808 [Cichlidogyrus casuarinus]|uniref:Uncharacterized protein n=1 Tax=Cichlidogyrus casuarinus TaxID=1844966 RepID=A0ABD2Q7L1_9PLAT